MSAGISPRAALAAAWPPIGGTTELVSVANGGTPTNNSSLPGNDSMSADGRYVAFSSFASNIVPGDTNNFDDIFVLDRTSAVVRRVSVSGSGLQANGASLWPTMSADGRFVAFVSYATNLVVGDTNGAGDVFEADLTTGLLSRMSVTSSGAQAGGGDDPRLSADGRYLVFSSGAADLIAGDTNASVDVFLSDRLTGIVRRISLTSSGTQGDGYSYLPRISADGRFVSMTSVATNLVSGDTNGVEDIYVVDLSSGDISRASVAATGAEGGDGSPLSAISADGRYVAFISFADNLVPGDTYFTGDLFVKDRTTGAVTWLSSGLGGVGGDGPSDQPSISADGRYVGFVSSASNLVAGDTNGAADVFVADRTASTVIRASVANDGSQLSTWSAGGGISADGLQMSFRSDRANVLGGTAGNYYDVFVRSLAPAPQPPSAVPGPPETVTAVAAAGMATVSWTAPSTGTGPLSGYTVTASPGGATCATTGATTCTVAGLQNGTAYTFAATAWNAVGTGAPSAASAAVVPLSVPEAPTSVTAVGASNGAAVGWTAPLGNGGTPITSYTVLASPGGASCTSTGATVCTFSGLLNGTAYAFTVAAANAVGTSASSLPSATVVPATLPGAPAVPVAMRGDRQVSVSWTPPSDNGGSAVTAYTVVANPGGASCSTTGLNCIVSGLVNGTGYTFTVIAINAVGSSTPSAPTALVVPATVPDRPLRIAVARAQRSVVVMWTAPSNGGSEISGYRVVAAPGGRTCATTGALRCTVSGLENGRSYRFTVTAANNVGTGLPSTTPIATIPAPVPGTPASLQIHRGNGRVTVSWTAPVANGTPAVTGYRVTARPGGHTCFTSGPLRCTVVGLVNGRSYQFTVVAVNRVGASPPSTSFGAVPAAAPGAVRALTAIYPAANRTVLSWRAPGTTGGLAILRNEVRTSADNGLTWRRWTSVGTARSATISGLAKGHGYLAEVRAVNGAGAGSPARLAVKPAR
ncbi:MAG: fibronectin type III domain-containing protein [Actinomycetota bacterium]